MAKNVSKTPRRAPEIGNNFGSAFASRNLKAGLSALTEMTTFHHTEKGFISETLFDFYHLNRTNNR